MKPTNVFKEREYSRVMIMFLLCEISQMGNLLVILIETPRSQPVKNTLKTCSLSAFFGIKPLNMAESSGIE